MSLPYATLVNACNANTLAKQSINKRHYTPSRALKKAYKLLRRVFRSSTSMSAEQSNTAQQSDKPAASIQSEANVFSTEEYDNYLNELAELESTAKKAITVESL